MDKRGKAYTKPHTEYENFRKFPWGENVKPLLLSFNTVLVVWTVQ